MLNSKQIIILRLLSLSADVGLQIDYTNQALPNLRLKLLMLSTYT